MHTKLKLLKQAIGDIFSLNRVFRLYCSHHVLFGGSSSPMFDSLSMLTASNSGGSRHGLRQALRFRKRRLRRTPQSPSLLPPFKSSDTICTATGAELGNSTTSFGPQDTWNKDICPYATFQVPGDSQQPSTSQQTTQQSLPQVTIKLQHHAQLDDNNLNTYRPAATAGFVCSTENPFVSNTTTDTFKIKPSTNVRIRTTN